MNPVRPALQGPEGFGGDGVEGADGGEGGNKAATGGDKAAKAAMAAKAANAVMAAKTLLSFSTCSSTGGILIPVVYIGHVLDVHRPLYTLIADR